MRPEYVWAVRVVHLDTGNRCRDLETSTQEMGDAVREATRVTSEFPTCAAWIELVGGETRRVQA